MNPADIIQLIQTAIPDAIVQPEGEGCSFKIAVTSTEFAGKTMLQQHQMVNKILAPALASGALHAVTLNTKTPA
ncbi:MAG: BolA/IbaG family iron-sulfur metabolism protein [Halothiobacillaceae bacterium]|nr:BolA/IbaG family iron-sulfur metabolism protein [Halothiobacillaceae bacterium]